MDRKKAKEHEKGAFQRVKGAVKRLFHREREAAEEPAMVAAPAATPKPKRRVEGHARPVRREADIPLDVLDRAYTPPATSSKASFRTDGADHQRDQEFASGAADGRWNDEDHYTNKSGDPRIGTHRRTYEPGEKTRKFE